MLIIRNNNSSLGLEIFVLDHFQIYHVVTFLCPDVRPSKWRKACKRNPDCLASNHNGNTNGIISITEELLEVKASEVRHSRAFCFIYNKVILLYSKVLLPRISRQPHHYYVELPGAKLISRQMLKGDLPLLLILIYALWNRSALLSLCLEDQRRPGSSLGFLARKSETSHFLSLAIFHFYLLFYRFDCNFCFIIVDCSVVESQAAKTINVLLKLLL